MDRNSHFEGKVAFVTGAGNGIGRATAVAFAHEGASVVSPTGHWNTAVTLSIRSSNSADRSSPSAAT